MATSPNSETTSLYPGFLTSNRGRPATWTLEDGTTTQGTVKLRILNAGRDGHLCNNKHISRHVKVMSDGLIWPKPYSAQQTPWLLKHLSKKKTEFNEQNVKVTNIWYGARDSFLESSPRLRNIYARTRTRNFMFRRRYFTSFKNEVYVTKDFRQRCHRQTHRCRKLPSVFHFHLYFFTFYVSFPHNPYVVSTYPRLVYLIFFPLFPFNLSSMRDRF